MGTEHEPFPDLRQASEILDPNHYYAGYVFDRSYEREKELHTFIDQARGLGYALRHWWVGRDMLPEGYLCRLIMCVHHPSDSGDAGIDLYDALNLEGVRWDDLVVETYLDYKYLGRPIKTVNDVCFPDGIRMFPRFPFTRRW